MMKVQEIVALAAEHLGREDLSARAAECSGEPEGELKSLVRCYNLIENEVALDYFPLKKEETFLPADGKIPFTAFSSTPVNVHKVKDGNGRDVEFSILPTHVALSADTGAVTVTYSYAPAAKTIADDSEFSGKISARLLSYGVVSEFCLTCARYREAALWEGKFRDALRAANLLRRKLCVPSRRWV